MSELTKSSNILLKKISIFLDKMLPKIKLFVYTIASTLLNVLFLSLWLAIQWFFRTYIIPNLYLTPIETWVVSTFKIIFAVSTLTPIACYVLLDIIGMLKEVIKEVWET